MISHFDTKIKAYPRIQIWVKLCANIKNVEIRYTFNMQSTSET